MNTKKNALNISRVIVRTNVTAGRPPAASYPGVC